MIERINLIGAITAIAFYISAILVFVLRLAGKSQLNY